MPKESFVAIGHMTNDLEPTPHLDGGVSYSAIAANKLGAETYIITRGPENHPYIKALRKMGIQVQVLPTRKEVFTSFRNVYGADGRTQRVDERQDPITRDDFELLPTELLRGATTLVAPVIGEVEPALFPELAKGGFVAVTPQGYFRQINSDGAVFQRPWDNFGEVLPHTRVAIFSDEDIRFNGKPDIQRLWEMRQVCQAVVLTRGAQGATIYRPDRRNVDIGALPLEEGEIKDLTGAGDTFAAALLTGLGKGLKIEEAAKNASFYAGLKLRGEEGIGTLSIPTLEQARCFMQENKARVREFLSKEGLSKLSLFD